LNFKNKWIRGLPGLILILGFTLTQSPQQAFAIAPDSAGLFQLDGNPQTCVVGVVPNNAPTADDWQTAVLAAPTHPPLTAIPSSCDTSHVPKPSASVFIQDGSKRGPFTTPLGTVPADTSFLTGGNTKDGNDYPSWLWSSTSDIQDKDDMQNAGAAAYTDPTSGHTIIYFFADRTANNGDANVGFWFNQGAVGTTGSVAAGGGGFSGTHKVGDELVLSNFGVGGSQPNIQVYKWTTSGPQLLTSGGACGSSTESPNECAIVNATTVQAIWPYSEKGSATTAYSSNEFYEGGIDITALNGGVTPCISSFLAETRSSSSITATLKDFALGSFQTCHAVISLSPSAAANQVGVPHPITANVQYAQGGGSFVNAPDGTTVNLSLAQANGSTASFCTTSACSVLVSTGTPAGSSTTCITSGGTCTVYLVSQTTGKITVNANASFTVGGQSLSASTTDPTNVTAGGTGAVFKWYVNGKISIDSNSTNEVTHSHTFTVTVQQDTGDGTGFHPASGVTVNTSIATDTTGGASITGGTCGPSGSTGAGGTCTVTVVSSNPGTVTLKAVTSSFSVTATGCSNPPTGFTCSPTLNPQPSVTGSSTNGGQKTFVDAAVTISPLKATNAVTNAETFTVSVYQNNGSGWSLASSALVTPTLTNANGTNATITGGTCTGTGANNLTSGQCTIIINASQAGQSTVSASAALTVSGVSLTRSTNGTDANCNPANLAANVPGCNSPPAVKTYVDAGITIGPSPSTNGIGAPHTFTVQLYQNLGDGKGFVASTATGVKVITSIVKDTTGHASIIGGTCGNLDTTVTPNIYDGTTTNGSCTVTVVSSSIGEVDVSATATLTLTPANGIASQPITVTTNGVGNMPNSGPAVKNYVAAEIDLTKHVQIGVLTAAPKVCYTLAYSSSDTAGPFNNPISTDTGINATGGVYTAGTDGSHATMQECFQYPSNTTGAFESDVSYKFSWHNVGNGAYSISEVVTPTPPYTANAPVSATVDLSTSMLVTVPDQFNPLPNGALTVTKTVNGGTVPIPNGATFTFHVYACGIGSTATNCVLSGSPTDVTGAPLTITGNGTSLSLSATLGGLQEGYYQVLEDAASMPACCTIDPTPGNNPKILAVAAGSSASTNVATINNLRLLKMIIFTCDMQNNLIQSQTTLSNAPDGQTGALNTFTSPPSGVTASQVCQLGPANYQKLQPNTTYNPSVLMGK
jgi:hypothetical protein